MDQQGIAERRVVTALFCDVVGSTTLAESMDPEDWSEVVKAAVGVIAVCVRRYDGTMSQFAGDSVLALFGAPIAHEDDPYRAIRTAVDILDEVRGVARHAGVDVQVRVGINTGLVVVGDIDAGALNVYSALGDVPNVAARLQALAAPGTILISGHTRRLVADDVEVVDRGATDLKGRALKVPAYEVTSVRGSDERRRGVEGLVSSMVGRDEELRTLEALVAAARSGSGRIAVLVGEPGVGKSRLVRELAASVIGTVPAAMWAEGRCVPYDEELPLHLVASLVRSLAGVTDAHDPAVTAKAVRDLARETLADDPADTDHLLTLLGLHDGDGADQDGPAAPDPESLHAAYHSTLERLVSALADRHGVVVAVCEDVHWVDASSAELVAALFPHVRSTPVLLLLVMRPDRDGDGWTMLADARRTVGAALTEIELRPLEEDESRQLVANLLEIESLPADLRRLVLDKAEGNPFFLEEVVRMLVERGMVEERDGRWVARPGIGDLEVPSTIQGLLASRIDRLPPQVRRTGRVAAVIGRRFPAGLLSAVLRPSEGDAGAAYTLHPDLAALEAHGMVQLEATGPEPEFSFRHALVHDVMYRGLLRRERATLHERVARAIEQRYPHRVDEFAGGLARHHEHAGNLREAVRYHLLAAAAARTRGARIEAHRSYDRAAALLERTEVADPDSMVRATLGAVASGMSFVPVHDNIARLEQVEPIARELDDPDLLAELYTTSIALRGMQGDSYRVSAYRRELELASAIAPRVSDPATRGMIRAITGQAMRSADEHRDAIAPLREAIELLDEAGRLAEASLNAAMLADSHATLGDFAAADRTIARAEQLAAASGDANALADTLLIEGRIASERGDLEHALTRIREGIATAEQAGNTFCSLAGNFFAADQELRLGQTHEAISHLERSTQLAGYCDAGGYETLSHAWLAEARARIGEAGPEHFEAPLAQARAAGSRSTEALVRLKRGIVVANSDDPTQAEADFRRAVELFDEIGARPSRARAQHAWGTALEALGRQEEAARLLQAAATTFEALGIRPEQPPSASQRLDDNGRGNHVADG